MTYTAVLFDLDGTLLDTLEDLGDSMNSVLSRHGFPVHPIRSYCRFVGDGVTNLVLRALPQEARTDRALVETLVPLMRAEYSQRWKDKTRPYEGIPELLSTLRERGARLAVLSNKPHSATLEVVEHFFPGGPFEVVLGARPGVPIKPDPAAATEVSVQMQVPATAFLYLGDTDTDMQTARAAGMFAVGALWGFREEQELVESGAQALAARPGEVIRLLER